MLIDWLKLSGIYNNKKIQPVDVEALCSLDIILVYIYSILKQWKIIYFA